ncbi:hypothetical protein [Streptomyces sp. NPDC005017]|uniref:hypothetical protein n=1 Tax=Streptomyces sp. NPDC005017 TaxID=3364706 RepID=UPI00369525D0
MPSADESGEAARTAVREHRLLYGVAAIKVIFVLALLRMLAGPFTKDFFDEELLPMPTWEWSLASLTPLALIYAARRPRDWAFLAPERAYFKTFLVFYFLWALAFAVVQGEWVLWIAVAAGLTGFAGMHRLNSRESADAH